MATNEHKKYVVVLVHGTFAPEAAWTQPGSRLRKMLSEQLGENLVHIEVFNWPGLFKKFNNSHFARLKAGMRLSKRLKQLQKEYTNAKIFIIGHSHGGNVALYALRDYGLRESIGGVVTFSTPFIECAERNITGTLEIGLSAVGLVLFTAFLNFAGKRSVELITMGHNFSVLWLTLTPVLLLYIFFIINLLSRREARANWIKNRTKSIVAELSLPQLSADKLFCAAGAWDEAAAGLYTLQTVSTFPHRLWNLAGFLRLYAFVVIVITVACCFNIPHSHDIMPVGFNEMLFSSREPISGNVPISLENLGRIIKLIFANFILALGLGVIAFMYMIAALALSITILPTVVRFLGFGWEGATRNLLTYIQIRKAPPGINRWKAYISKGKGLAHSRLYDDPEVLRDVAKWIKQRVSQARGF